MKKGNRIYDELKKNGCFDIEEIADYPLCDLVTLGGLKKLTDGFTGLDVSDRIKLQKNGDPNSIYLWTSDNAVYRLCRLTEKNAALLEKKLEKTSAGFLENVLRRLDFEK